MPYFKLKLAPIDNIKEDVIFSDIRLCRRYHIFGNPIEGIISTLSYKEWKQYFSIRNDSETLFEIVRNHVHTYQLRNYGMTSILAANTIVEEIFSLSKFGSISQVSRDIEEAKTFYNTPEGQYDIFLMNQYGPELYLTTLNMSYEERIQFIALTEKRSGINVKERYDNAIQRANQGLDPNIDLIRSDVEISKDMKKHGQQQQQEEDSRLTPEKQAAINQAREKLRQEMARKGRNKTINTEHENKQFDGLGD